jgi:RNA polymerase sigma factor (sigma-70 family)
VSNALRDLVIWDNFREGNREALEIIYEDNYSPLFHYALKFTNDKDLIQDLIQELFVELINSGKKLAKTDNIRVYLLKALRNKILFQLARKVKRQSHFPDHKEFNLLDSIEAQLIKKEVDEDIQIRITSAVKKLSPKQQEVIYLRFYQDMPYPEIAGLFDVKVQTVRNLLTRAITQLKEELGDKNINKQMILFLLNLRNPAYISKKSDLCFIA